ncbi:MAG: mechanosensitive ion channel family protein [Myxococcota bacterium]
MGMLTALWEQIDLWWSSEQARVVLRVVVLLLGTVLAARLLRASVLRLSNTFLVHEQQRVLLGRAVSYGIIALGGVAILQQLGFDLSVLLGTAGILTVAIGFASQTSASNIISGLFLVAERPFVMGDVIRIGSTTGVVLSVDLISIKLRTFDNLFVRIPNEAVLKAEVVNVSRFPIRRYDLALSVDYAEDLDHVRNVLLDVADDNILCLIEPPPEVVFIAFGASGIDLRFSVWAARENFLKVRDSLPGEVKARFDAEQITIPFPQQVVSFRPQPRTPHHRDDDTPGEPP